MKRGRLLAVVVAVLLMDALLLMRGSSAQTLWGHYHVNEQPSVVPPTPTITATTSATATPTATNTATATSTATATATQTATPTATATCVADGGSCPNAEGATDTVCCSPDSCVGTGAPNQFVCAYVCGIDMGGATGDCPNCTATLCNESCADALRGSGMCTDSSTCICTGS